STKQRTPIAVLPSRQIAIRPTVAVEPGAIPTVEIAPSTADDVRFLGEILNLGDGFFPQELRWELTNDVGELKIIKPDLSTAALPEQLAPDDFNISWAQIKP